jgi:hypothetical protein
MTHHLHSNAVMPVRPVRDTPVVGVCAPPALEEVSVQ